MHVLITIEENLEETNKTFLLLYPRPGKEFYFGIDICALKSLLVIFDPIV